MAKSTGIGRDGRIDQSIDGTGDEATIQNAIRLAVSSAGARVFRNNVGAFRDKRDRLITFGLCKGSSDLIGWRSMTITPAMVGKQVAVFTAIECKAVKGRPTDEQVNFIRVVRESGGLAGIARSAADAEEIIHGGF